MNSRPKSQENSHKTRLLTPNEVKCRRNSNINCVKTPERNVAEISMKDFLDFLKISYQVNGTVEGDKKDVGDKISFDWQRLTNHKLIDQLKAEDDSAKEATKIANKPLPCTGSPGTSTEAVRNEAKTEPVKSCIELCKKVPSKSSCQNSEDKNTDKKERIEIIWRGDIHEKDEGVPLVERKCAKEKRCPSRKGRDSTGSLEKGGSEEKELDKPDECRTAEKILKKKLNEVLQEGILDSVLPYLLPKQDHQIVSSLQPPPKKLLLSNDMKKPSSTAIGEKSVSTSAKEKREIRRKSVSSNDSDKAAKFDKKDVEVVIHVCDEIKNLKKDFKCRQRLLISEMGYFAEVTNGQKLEDMDISVHCDVSIFDWLMRWVQRDRAKEETWPRLDPAIVVPVLLSSAFLQMDQLQDHCLKYCRYNINEILRDSNNLNCINDSILTKLANMFSNSEVENLKDRRDKLQSKLYCKLIMALTEPQPQPHRGHYSTVATMYRCCKCSKLILRNISTSILCVPGCMIMDRNGFVMSSHVRDPTWNLTEYVKSLKNDLKVWKKVYWRLWSDCHLLFCHTCSSYFPVHQMYWCRYHSEPAQFYMKENQRNLGYPIGRYPCCGERAYRFELLKNKLGCQYREHNTEPKSVVEMEIYKMWNDHRDLIKADPPPIATSERVRLHSKAPMEDGTDKKSPVKETYWWDGLQLVPPQAKTGLFSTIWERINKKEDTKSTVDPESRGSHSPSVKKSVASSRGYGFDLSTSSDSSDQQSSASDAEDSEDSGPTTVRCAAKPKSSMIASQSIAAARLSCIRKEKRKRKKKRKSSKGSRKNEGSRFWVPKLSTRCNQDNQREFEERAFRQIESLLIRKLSGDVLSCSASRTNCQSTPPGGIYVKLEQEWREAHCNAGCTGGSVKAKPSSSTHGSSITSSNTSSGRPRTKSHRL